MREGAVPWCLEDMEVENGLVRWFPFSPASVEEEGYLIGCHELLYQSMFKIDKARESSVQEHVALLGAKIKGGWDVEGWLV